MIPTASLVKCTDSQVYANLLRNYYQSLVLFVNNRKSKPNKPSILKELDDWVQFGLPKLIRKREEPFMKQSELNKLMAWKLTRGKFRPRLQMLVESNDKAFVEEVTKEAFIKMPNVQSAIAELCKLKGVGPATASGVLCALTNGKVGFLADEAASAISKSIGPVLYTAPYYLKFNNWLEEKANSLNAANPNLNQGQESSKKFDAFYTLTPHDVERALWIAEMTHKLGISDADLDELKEKEDVSYKRSSKPSSSSNKKAKKDD